MLTSVDWPAFLGQHDMYFTAPPTRWEEAPHFGNAMIGSMFYMRDRKLCMPVFRADVRDHRDESHGWTAYSRPRFRIGYFLLETVGTPIGISWRKDLWNAELTGTISTDCGEIVIRHFVHATDMAIVTELTPSEGEDRLIWSWHPYEANTSRPGYPTDDKSRKVFADRYGKHYLQTIKSPVANPEGRLEREGGVSVWIQDLLAGGQYATAWGVNLREKTLTHIVSITKSYPEASAAREARANVNAFLEKDRQAWLEVHRAWWHAYYPRSYVHIPDKALESLYWQTIYRYGCTSRTGRSYVDTAGLWAQGGPWPYTTNDWNTQSAHWGVYAANRLEQGEEIVNCLHAGMDNMIAAVYPEAWRDDSAYLHLATAEDMAGSRISDMRYYHCVGCLPWLLQNAWCQYRFSMDDAMLRETVFPLLRRAVNFYLHIAHADDDGRLHLEPTYSPETGVWKDANFDLSLFKWGCHILLKACKRLRIDDPVIAKWQAAIETSIDFPVDEQGFMLGSEQTAKAHHRHLSHLLMIYPLFLVNIEQEGSTDVLLRSHALVHDGEGSDDGAIQPLHAMVQTHAVPIAAALGLGDKALDGTLRMVAEFTPNGLWGCGGSPCIESTLSVINNIQDMLIQSWSDPARDEHGPIRIFPALPSTWQDVEFHDLRTEGAFLVSAKRMSGVTQWVRIQSLAGEPCHVRVDLEAPVVEGDRERQIDCIVPGLVKIDLQAGETVTLVSSIKPRT